jgi:hypothetical protein
LVGENGQNMALVIKYLSDCTYIVNCYCIYKMQEGKQKTRIYGWLTTCTVTLKGGYGNA